MASEYVLRSGMTLAVGFPAAVFPHSAYGRIPGIFCHSADLPSGHLTEGRRSGVQTDSSPHSSGLVVFCPSWRYWTLSLLSYLLHPLQLFGHSHLERCSAVTQRRQLSLCFAAVPTYPEHSSFKYSMHSAFSGTSGKSIDNPYCRYKMDRSGRGIVQLLSLLLCGSHWSLSISYTDIFLLISHKGHYTA